MQCARCLLESRHTYHSAPDVCLRALIRENRRLKARADRLERAAAIERANISGRGIQMFMTQVSSMQAAVKQYDLMIFQLQQRITFLLTEYSRLKGIAA